jgi:hypothetical protein
MANPLKEHKYKHGSVELNVMDQFKHKKFSPWVGATYNKGLENHRKTIFESPLVPFASY